MEDNRPHLHSILGAALVSAFAFIVGLLSIDPMIAINFGQWLVIILILFSVSVVLQLLQYMPSIKIRRDFLDKWAINTFLIGFLLLIFVTASSIIMIPSYSSILLADKLPYLFVGLFIGLVIGLSVNLHRFLQKIATKPRPRTGALLYDN